MSRSIDLAGSRGGIYLRLSQKGEPQKFADQHAMVQRLAEERRVEVVAVYDEDNGVSAFSGKPRPGWERMLEDVAHGNLDVILAQADDRLARNAHDKLKLDELCAMAGVVYLTLAYPIPVDPGTADGEFHSLQTTALSRMYSRKMSEKMREANEERRTTGRRPIGSLRAFGYASDGSLHPVEAPLVQWMYETCLESETVGLSAIMTKLNKDEVDTVNGRPWDSPKVEKVLRRARNAGLLEHKDKGAKLPALVRGADGDLVRGGWPRIVDEDTYFTVLAKLDDPRRKLKKLREPHHLLSSIALCACGVKMRPGGTANGKTTYRCGVHQNAAHKQDGVRHTSCPSVELDRLVTRQLMHALVLMPTFGQPTPSGNKIHKLTQDLVANRRSQARTAQMVDDPDFSYEIAKAQSARLRAEEQRLQHELDTLRQHDAQASLLADLAFRVLNPGRVNLDDVEALYADITTKFGKLALEERRALVRTYFSEIRVNPGRGLASRVKIVHKAAVQLNEPGIDPDE